MNGSTHAYVALPAWVIGRPISPPLGTVAQAPSATAIGGSITGTQAFLWNAADSNFYAIAPCTAEILWPTSVLNPLNPTNTTPSILTVSKSVWPRLAQTHVVGLRCRSCRKACPPAPPSTTAFNPSCTRRPQRGGGCQQRLHLPDQCLQRAALPRHFPGRNARCAPFAECFPSRPFRRLE